ncbi:MAG: hypothetical protein O9262_08930, partial [Cyclobacteriaceae bacterium]|nr:hypothetical protein [Cyclobacteriaceae bacterium]
MRLTALLFIICLINTWVYGQELKRRIITRKGFVEEYLVLKEDKAIRQGQYFKFKKDLLDRNILVEIGNYDLNKRTGVWYTFFSHGSLKSYGPYVDNEKEGPWKEFYRLENDNALRHFSGIQHSAQLNQDGNIEISEDNLNISAQGMY